MSVKEKKGIKFINKERKEVKKESKVINMSDHIRIHKEVRLKKCCS